MFREDYILRMVQQLAEAIARIAGLNQREQHDEALADADRAWGELLGDIPPELAGSVGSPTPARLPRPPPRGRAPAGPPPPPGRPGPGPGLGANGPGAPAGGAAPAGPPRRARRALELLLEA